MFIYAKLLNTKSDTLIKLDFLLSTYGARRECVLSKEKLKSLAEALKSGGEGLARIRDIKCQQRIFVNDLRNIEPLMESLRSEEMQRLVYSKTVSLHPELSEQPSARVVPAPFPPSAA